jgi:CheY-like chemotaxis protein
MNVTGPVVIIEDDEDDQQMLSEIFKNLAYDNEVIFFADGNKALVYLNQTDVTPFLILSDINMPRIDGMALRAMVKQNEKLNVKCIPYLFFTTAADKKFVMDAYSMSVQGFFKKPSSYEKLENTVRIIMEYWKECISPNQYEESTKAITAS